MLRRHKHKSDKTNRRVSHGNMRLRRRFDRGLIVDTDRVANLEFDSERRVTKHSSMTTAYEKTKVHVSDHDGAINRSQAHVMSSISLLRIIFSFVLFIIFVTGLAWMFRVSAVNVKLVGASDGMNSSKITRDYEMEMKRLNRTKFWGLTPMVVSSRIESDIKTRHPEVQSITMNRRFPGKSLNVEITLRQPVLVWQTSRGNRYFIDNLGNVFAKNYTEKATPSLPLVIDRTMAEIPANNKAPVSQDTIDYIMAFDSAIATKLSKSKQIESFNLSIAPNGLDVKLTGVKYIIRLQSTGDVGQDSEMLRRALKYFDNNRSLTPEKYLDLRLVGRGYYQ